MEPWDVVVGGGGPAGAAAALVLAAAERRVLVLAAPGPSRRGVGEGLPGGARTLLRRLGALETVERGGHLPSPGVASSWGSPELAPAQEAARSPHGQGWHLDRRAFDADLLGLAQAGRASVLTARLAHIEPPAGGAGGWRLGTEEGEDFEARFLVDATGRTAVFARRLGARRRRDDDLAAVVAWVPRTGSAETRTVLEAVPDGWWYTAPLPGNERVLAFHGAAGDVGELRRDPLRWADRLAATRWVKAGLEAALTAPEDFLLEPLRLADAAGARLDRFAGEGWLAVGDAALAFDPLSSQGLLTALYSGVLAGEALDAALGGDPTPLADYPNRLEAVRTAYLRHHRDAYRDEGRWLDRPFWIKRG